MAVNEHDRLCYFSLRRQLKYRDSTFRVLTISVATASPTMSITHTLKWEWNGPRLQFLVVFLTSVDKCYLWANKLRCLGSVLVYIINNKSLLRDNIMTGGLVSAMLWYMSQVRNSITNVICHVLFCVQWVKMRGDVRIIYIGWIVDPYWFYLSNTMGATSGEGTDYPFRTPEFTLSF